MGIGRLRQVSMQIDNDIEDLQVGKELFDAEIQGYDIDDDEGNFPNLKRLEELRQGMETWIDVVERSLNDCEDEIKNYKREVMLRRLKNETDKS